jgi:hypothetical protein
MSDMMFDDHLGRQTQSRFCFADQAKLESFKISRVQDYKAAITQAALVLDFALSFAWDRYIDERDTYTITLYSIIVSSTRP